MGSKNKTSKRDKKQVTDSSHVREDIGNKRGNSGKKDVVTDPRFSHVHYDPKFARARKQKTKVAIDSRFDRIFTDKNFSSTSAQADKRGKPKKKDIENPLKHYYHLEDDEGRIKEVNEDLISQVEDDEANEESESESENDEAHKESEIESENDETNKESESESDIDELKRVKGKVQDIESEDEEDVDVDDEEEDAEGDRSSADAADTTDSDNEEEVYSMEQDNFEQEENVPEIDKETNRLGVVNLDWNHVRAVDIFMLFTSFLPKGGKMLSVSVYPSEFGLKRMEEEAVRGPVGLFDDDAEKDDDSEDDDDNDDEIDDNKLRAYELSRLRYYYAVVECDSVATADYLYKTCDGLEFERSSNRLDLRFIPDSMEFKHPPRDVATEAPSIYEGMDFHSKVLQLSKIELTWDEDEPQRSKSLKRKFNADQLADMELKEFLASDDSESESDDDNDGDDDDVMEHKPEKKRKKQELYRALLQSGGDSDEDNDDNKGDMEVTFNTGLEELSKKHLEKKNKESETVWEAYLRKKKEKKKTKKNRSKNSSDDDESSGSDEEPRQEDADDFFIEEPTGKADKKQKKQKGAVDETEAGRAELELLLANDESEINTGLKGYNMKAKKKSKGKKGNKNNSEEIEDDGKLPTAADYDDPRFSLLFTSPQFALDPTDPQFKRSAAYARQLAQKQGKSGREEKGAKQNKEVPEPTVVVPTVEKDPVKLEASSKKKDKLELSSLVKSLKMKSQNFQVCSKNKPPTNSKTRK